MAPGETANCQVKLKLLQISRVGLAITSNVTVECGRSLALLF